MQFNSGQQTEVVFVELPKLPKQLYYEGNVSLLEKRLVTFVGTRNITQYGKWCIEYLLHDFLKELDIVVVSGLAKGVDAYVHEVCLKRGINTIAIVPGGIDTAVPKCNRELFENIKRKGLVLAEFPKDTFLKREMFVLRNRLLAGISEMTIVIEAGLGSGSLITAGLALEFNRDVYVIPGNINNKMSHGCNILAREGAGIITCLDDFKQVLGVEDDQVLFKL
jgi:DNA processing protein